MTRTKIKICGLQRPEDILFVNEARPDFAGFIIDVPKSRRNVSPEKVRELTASLSPEILPVGVFVNAPMETILSLVKDGTLKAVQLHGQESQSYLTELKNQVSVPVIRAFSIHSAADLEKPRKVPQTSSFWTTEPVVQEQPLTGHFLPLLTDLFFWQEA